MMTKKYSAALTREQFLFRETRIVAQLMDEGLTDDAIYQKIMAENLFQLPTEKSMRSLIRPCVRRLRGLEDEAAVHMIAKEPLSTARQLCLYAMMRDSRLVAEFMVTVIGEKYRQHDTNFSRADIRIFFLHLVEQNDQASTWTEATIKKLSSVLMSILVQNGYLANPRAKELQPVILQSPVRDAIKRHHDEWMLPAFHVL
ncbi:DUF1819 family protein [Mitsuokella multacida]|uniref:DUF1819 family protein n=1 Tax=Mitsuokella multacida TaxID=52226 RepID=UPI0026654571|nr:DUF1819 family protein [Mitsuokella multacida]